MSDEDLENLLRGFEDSLGRDDLAGAREIVAQLEAELGPEHVEVLYARARLDLCDDRLAPARSLLEQVVLLDPEHADAHYDLGCIAEMLGEREAMIEAFLRVRGLDAAFDRELGIGSETQLQHIEQVAREVLDGLPALFGERLRHVPVLIEQRPSRALVADGFDPRAFGLFDGPNDAERGAPLPTRIVLYAANLLAEFPEDPELREQVEVTVLHEVGHFFGLDEDQLARLGLD